MFLGPLNLPNQLNKVLIELVVVQHVRDGHVGRDALPLALDRLLLLT